MTTNPYDAAVIQWMKSVAEYRERSKASQMRLAHDLNELYGNPPSAIATWMKQRGRSKS